MAAGKQFINNFSTTLDEAISNSDTSFDLVDATGLSGNVGSGKYVTLTIDDGTNREIVYCTAVSSNTVTVTRGREGTSGTAFSAGDLIEGRLTASGLVDLSEWQLADVQILGSNETEVEFDLSFGGTYKIVLDDVVVSSTDDILLQQATAGPSYQTATYYHSGQVSNYTGGDSANQGNNASSIKLFPAPSDAASNTILGEIIICNVGNGSERHHIHYQMGQQAKNIRGGGIRDVAEAVTNVKLFFSGSGEFVAGSRFLLYRRNGLG